MTPLQFYYTYSVGDEPPNSNRTKGMRSGEILLITGDVQVRRRHIWIKNKARVILYFIYCQQILLKDQNQQYIFDFPALSVPMSLKRIYSN